MSLDLYEYEKDNVQYLKISQEGSQTRPIQTTHNGTNGEVVEKQIFIRNENQNFYYTNVRLTPYPPEKVKIGSSEYPEANIGYKIKVKSTQPTKDEWDAIKSGDTAVIPAIGTTDSSDNLYKSVWIQVSVPPGTRIGALRDISIECDAEENPIGA